MKFARALDRGEHRPHQEEVAEELVLPARRQVAIMRGGVSHDDQRVLARANEHNREYVEHRVPEIGAERDGGGNRDPFACGRGKRSRSVQPRQVFDDRGRQALGDSPDRVVGSTTTELVEMSSAGISVRRKAMTLLTLARFGISLLGTEHNAVARFRYLR